MAVVSGRGSSCSGSGTAQDEEKVPAPHRAGSSQPQGGRGLINQWSTLGYKPHSFPHSPSQKVA